MRLYLVQHGDAVDKDVDPQRPLSDQGIADVGRLASRLSSAGVSVGRIVHSGKLRAEQTAVILEPLLMAGGGVEARSGLAPNDAPELLLSSVNDVDTIVAGHLPFVSRAVSLALGLPADQTAVQFQPGSVAVLEQVDDSWRLVAFIRPEHV